MAIFEFIKDTFKHILWKRTSKIHFNCLDLVILSSAVFLFTRVPYWSVVLKVLSSEMDQAESRLIR